MRTRQLFSAFVAGAFSLCFAMSAHAQNPMQHITDPSNASLDYMIPTDQYLLSGTIQPPTIGGMSNVASFGFLPRIQLQVLNNGALNTALYKTYCTAAEVNAVLKQECSTLSVAFYQADAKQTADGGYILCGYVVRTSEYTSCPGNDYINPYLIKTNAAGVVTWYMRYNSGWDNRTRFNSVIEDPLTGNFVVCGVTTPALGILPTAFVMGTNPMGNVLWAHNIMTTKYGDPTTPQTSEYTEITTYTDLMGNQRLALTGTVGYGFYYGYGINTGGGLLTVLDGTGLVFTNVYITQDPYNQFMQLKGINDAHDGDVVLTGFSGGNNCGAHNGFNLLIMKINPMTLATAFMKVYQTNPANMFDVSFGNSITVSTGVAANTIAITGNENTGVGSDFAIFAITNYAGGLIRYTQHTPANAVDGKAIVYNTAHNYYAYSGNWGSGTFITHDKYGYACEPNVYPPDIDLPHDIVANYYVDPPVNEIPDNLIDFNMTSPEGLACGVYKPAPATPATAAVSVKGLTLTPNPTEDYINVQLPDALKSATVKVYDMTGRLVATQVADAAKAELRIDVAKLANGMYMVTAEDKGVKEHSTFVKQ